MDTSTTTKDRLVRLPEVMTRTGMSRSWLYDAMREGSFPRAIRIGGRAVAWRDSDLSQWLAALATSPSQKVIP